MDERAAQESQPEAGDPHLRRYAGRWIARIGARIIGQGGTPEQALYAAKDYRHKETPEIIYVPTLTPISISDQIEQLIKFFPGDLPVYLVGGAVRDALLGRITHDLDFVLAKDSMKVARRLANALGAAYFPLDETRQTARVVILKKGQPRQAIDFALFRGADLENDLSARDFTINAMAVEVRDPQRLLDPLGGLADLRAKRLRACSANAFRDDPTRILRGVRLAMTFKFRIEPETRQQMRLGVSGLSAVSAERIRDELARILEGKQPATSIWALDLLGAISYTFPEIAKLKTPSEPEADFQGAWRHTLDLLKRLDILTRALGPVHDAESAASFTLGLVSVQLGRYRDQISARLGTQLVPERSLRFLLFLAGLYQEVGKPEVRRIDAHGRVRYPGYEGVSAKLLRERGRALRLSNDEIDHASRIVAYHNRIQSIAGGERPISRREIYRFFRDTGSAGVDICLLSLANLWAQYGSSISQEAWVQYLEAVRTLLDAWFESRDEVVSPGLLVNGHELMVEFGLPPGPEIGVLLEAIREAQAAGEVEDREQALNYVRSQLKGD